MDRFVAVSLAIAMATALWGCSAVGGETTPTAPAAHTDWIANTAIYEVFVRDFSEEGTFEGLVDGLDRIEAVGAEVVWLMPIHPIGEIERKGPLGSPYSIVDYRALNPDFGDEDDFRSLVSAVHARDMKLIMDWVPNHTAWDHRWVTDHPEWYTRNEEGEMTHPRGNDGNLTDWTDVAELDFSNADMRRAMIADMRYWLEEFNVDGFRVDVAGMVPDDFWREAIPQLRAVKPILLLAEWGDPNMHELGFDLTYAWSSYSRLKEVWEGGSAAAFATGEIDDLATIPTGGLRMRFNTNHDETAWDAPPVTLFGGSAGARASFIASALLPGRPLIYNGQEVESPQRLGLFVKDAIVWDQPGAEATTQFYRRVVDLARTHSDFVEAPLETLAVTSPDDVIAYRRGNALVLVNARPRAVRFDVPEVSLVGAQDLLTGSAYNESEIRLGPHGALVLELAP